MSQTIVPLWKHQEEGATAMINLPWYALHFAPGVGKSRTTIEALKINFNTSKRIKRTLIFCPAIVVGNWKEEWLKYSKIDPSKVVLLQGSQVKRVATFKKYGYDETGLYRKDVIFVTNYEAVEMKDLYKLMKDWAPEILVFDEAHRLKNPAAKRSKLIEELSNSKKNPPEKRYELTGTAVLNSPLDLFMQFKILMGGFPTANHIVTRNSSDLVTNFYQFRSLFFVDANAGFKTRDNYFPNWVPKQGAINSISAILKHYAMSVKIEDCLDLPGERDILMDVPLSAAQKRDYDCMNKDGVILKPGQAFTADLALTQTMRLMQICSGFISGQELDSNDEMQTIKHLYADNLRDEVLEDLLQTICVDAGKKVLVWAVWKQNYAAIKAVCDKLGVKYVEVNGSISGEEKEKARKSFINDDSIKVWIGHPNAGGIGVNLVVAPYTIWYSRSYSLEQYEQAKARNYRGGQTEKVTHYHLVSKGTIEEAVLESLREKKTMAEMISKFTRIINIKK